MPYDGGTAVVRVIADAKGLNASLTAATKGATGTFGKVGQSIGTALSNPIVLAGAAVAGVTAKLAYDFDAAFTRIGALSNASEKDIESWKGQVMSLSGETAQAPQELADALFFLSSAGLEANEVMPALEASAKGAAVGLGTAADVANITASAMNAYADSGLTAAHVTDVLVAGVKAGRAEPEEFAKALGRILPITSQVGVSIDQVVGSLASLSNIGLDVNEAVTAMRGALQAVSAPGSQAANALADLGLSAQDMLDAISERGLFGALQMLDKAAQANTDTQADYIGVLRKVIPNVRALTGVLGLTGQEAKKVRDIFNQTANASGELGSSLKDTQASAAFQFKKALNDLVVIGTEIGQNVLPAITDVLEALAPLLGFAAKNAKLLLTVFLGYKAIKFIPSVLSAVGVNLTAIGGGSLAGAGGLAKFAAGLKFLGAPGLVAAGALVATAYGMEQDSKNAAEAETRVTSLAKAFASGAISSTELSRRLAEGTHQVFSMNGGVQSLETSLGHTERETRDLAYAMGRAGMAAGMATVEVDKLGRPLRVTHREAKMTAEEIEQLGKVMEDVAPKFDAMSGGLLGVEHAFKTTAQAAADSATDLGSHQRDILKDLRELDDANIGDRLKARIAALGPDMVHAFVTGNASQKQAIIKGLNVYQTALRASNRLLETIMYNGGVKVGKRLPEGAADGIDAAAGGAAEAAARMGRAILARLESELEIHSASKAAWRDGVFFVEGFIKGMESQSSKLLKTVQKLGDLIKTALDDELKDALTKGQLDFAKGLEKRIQQATNDLDKLVDKFRSFKDSIRSGFDSLGDFGSLISGGVNDYLAAMKAWEEASAAGETVGEMPAAFDIGGAIAAQVAQAQELAKLLADAAEAGLSKGLLAQFAGQGAGAIPALQELLANPELIGALNQAQKQIAKAAGDTAEQLGEKFFGKAIRNATNHLDHLADALVRFIARLQRMLGDVSAGISAQLAAIQAQAAAAAAVPTGGGTGTGTGGGGTGGGGTHHGSGGPWSPPNQPPTGGGGGSGNKPHITVNVNGWVGNDQDIAARVRNELLRVGRNNGGTGL
jgi:TP901 family phage tail tape measure protein